MNNLARLTSLQANKLRSVRGFTLIELMVAIFMMAIIGVIAGQAFHTATSTSQATDDAIKRLSSVDKFWVLLENDLRNALAQEVKPGFAKPIPAMSVQVSSSVGGDYFFTMVRGGLANPLFQPRTEVVRIGYRLVEDEGSVWRDTWYDIRSTDELEAVQRKVMSGVKELAVRVLMPNASSLAAGPWEVNWPKNPSQNGVLPIALEFMIEHEDFGEIKKLISILSVPNNSKIQ